MTKVFISHSTENREMVEERILAPLREAGISWWYGPNNIEGGSEWEREILRGLRSCSHFILAMTPEAAESPWVRTEVHWAIENRFQTLLPVLLSPVAPEEFHLRLIGLQHVDLTASDGGAKLLQLLRSRLEQEESPTPEEKARESEAREEEWARTQDHLMRECDRMNDFFADFFDKPSPSEPSPSDSGAPVRTLREAIGIEVKDAGIESFMPIFARGTPLPAEQQVEFSTFEDNQAAVDVKPLAASGHEGTEIAPMEKFRIVDRIVPSPGNDTPRIRRLGVFSLDNLAPQPKGVPRIEVTFHLDEFGTLDVSAIERGTHRSASGIFDQVGVAEEGPAKVVVDCPDCGVSFRVPGDLRLLATCPGCGTRIEVNQGRIV